MSPVCVPGQFGFSRSFINQPRLGVNHKTMIVKIKTTGLKGKPENITTQILSREERGVAGRGSLRAERTTGTGGKKKSIAFREWWWWKKPFGSSRVNLFILQMRRERCIEGSNLPLVSEPTRGKGETMNDFTPKRVPTAPCHGLTSPVPGIQNRPGLSEERVSRKTKHHLGVYGKASQFISKARAKDWCSS